MRSAAYLLSLGLIACSAGSSSPEPRPVSNTDPVAIPASTAHTQGTPGAGEQGAAADTKARLLSAFSAREQRYSKEDLLAAGSPSDVEAALISIASDEGAKLQHRLAAVGALRWFPSATSKATLEDTIDHGGVALRRSAVRSYGTAFSTEAIPVLTHALSNDDIHTRIGAIQALKETGTLAARKAVENHLNGTEPNEAVRSAARSALDSWK